jgi:hypothetical protein
MEPSILNVYFTSKRTVFSDADRCNKLRELASDGNTDFTIHDENEDNVFHHCVHDNSEDRLDAIRAGLQKLKDINVTVEQALNERNKKGLTPLCFVADKPQSKAYDIACKLLKLGANPEITNIQGKTPECLAKEARDSRVHELLKNIRVRRGLRESLRPTLSNFVVALKQIENMPEFGQEDKQDVDQKGNNLIMLAMKCGIKEQKPEEETLLLEKKALM